MQNMQEFALPNLLMRSRCPTPDNSSCSTRSWSWYSGCSSRVTGLESDSDKAGVLQFTGSLGDFKL